MLKSEYNLSEYLDMNKMEEIAKGKKDDLNFITYYISTFIKILKTNFVEKSEYKLGRKNHFIMELVYQTFIYMREKPEHIDTILISTEFIQKSIIFFFKYQLNNIYQYKFVRLFSLFLENESDHLRLRDYLFKEIKFHEKLADYVIHEENVVQRPIRERTIEEKKENENKEETDNKNSEQKENDIKEKKNEISEKKEDKEDNIQEIENKEKENIVGENKDEKENIKKEKNNETVNIIEENGEKRTEKTNEIGNKINEEEKIDNKINCDKIEENDNNKNIEEKGTINDNKIEEKNEKEAQKDVIFNKKSSKKKLSLIYPFIIELSYKIQTICGLKTFDEEEQKSLGILNLGDFEFVKDEQSTKTKINRAISDKLKEIIQLSDNWKTAIESKIIPAIRRYESKLCKVKVIEKPKINTSNANFLNLLTLLTNSLKQKSKEGDSKAKKVEEKNDKKEGDKNEDLIDSKEKNLNEEESPKIASSTEDIKTEKENTNINDIKKESNSEIEIDNKEYNDNNFWQIEIKSLINEKEMVDIINNL